MIENLEELQYILNSGFKGEIVVSEKIKNKLYGFYVYDERRVPTHVSHLKYKKKYMYFDFINYFCHYFDVEAVEIGINEHRIWVK